MKQLRMCHACLLEKEESEFEFCGNSKKYRRRICFNCRRETYRRQYVERNREQINRKAKEKRRSNVVLAVLKDCRAADHKKGRENTMTEGTVRDALSKECPYCGETELRMTLDRIDNSKGHTPDNVVPACIRCNYTRKTIPYEAWLIVAPKMREAREKGLFGSWTGRTR